MSTVDWRTVGTAMASATAVAVISSGIWIAGNGPFSEGDSRDGQDPVTSAELIQVVPRDSIPALLSPDVVDRETADQQMHDDEPVLGVSVGREHRAYSLPYLSTYEIANDELGGKPIAVTW